MRTTLNKRQLGARPIQDERASRRKNPHTIIQQTNTRTILRIHERTGLGTNRHTITSIHCCAAFSDDTSITRHARVHTSIHAHARTLTRRHRLKRRQHKHVAGHNTQSLPRRAAAVYSKRLTLGRNHVNAINTIVRQCGANIFIRSRNRNNLTITTHTFHDTYSILLKNSRHTMRARRSPYSK